ncbi:MAG: hypothetical protein JWR45_2178 [Blastococcus sp.]|nr:hypothetical protein [Blastococcus sp.]
MRHRLPLVHQPSHGGSGTRPAVRFRARRVADTPHMDLKKPLIVLALLGSLVACGDNTNVDRGETNCDSSGQQANNAHDASCQQTGTPDPSGNLDD